MLFFNKIKQFINHFKVPFYRSERNLYNKTSHQILYLYNALLWVLLIPVKCLEIFGLSTVLKSLFLLTVKVRPLSDKEVSALTPIFGDTIAYDKIRINESSYWAKWGAKYKHKTHMAFVWLSIINFSRNINVINNKNDLHWLVHEVVHVKQYESLGLQYIFEALLAQKYGGYYYGGVSSLKLQPLKFYNLEQQADLIKDLYKHHLYHTAVGKRILSEFEKGDF